jgi:hypothetical protein
MGNTKPLRLQLFRAPAANSARTTRKWLEYCTFRIATLFLECGLGGVECRASKPILKTSESRSGEVGLLLLFVVRIRGEQADVLLRGHGVYRCWGSAQLDPDNRRGRVLLSQSLQGFDVAGIPRLAGVADVFGWFGHCAVCPLIFPVDPGGSASTAKHYRTQSRLNKITRTWCRSVPGKSCISRVILAAPGAGSSDRLPRRVIQRRRSPTWIIAGVKLPEAVELDLAFS